MESPVIYGFRGATGGDSTSIIDGSIVAKNVRIKKHYRSWEREKKVKIKKEIRKSGKAVCESK